MVYPRPFLVHFIFIAFFGVSGCSSENRRRPEQEPFIADWEKWSKLVAGDEYVAEGSIEVTDGSSGPPSVRKVKVVRDGSRYCVFFEYPNRKTYARVSNSESSSALSSSGDGQWVLDEHHPADSSRYARSHYATVKADMVHGAVTADCLLEYANHVPLRCDTTDVPLGRISIDVGWGKDGHQPLDGIFSPVSSVLSLTNAGEAQPRKGWLRQWDTIWDSQIPSGTLRRHVRVELADWKSFGPSFGELPSKLISYNDESGKEIWYMTRTIESMRSLGPEDREFLRLSRFGIPELEEKKKSRWPIWVAVAGAVVLLVLIVRSKRR